MLNTEQKQTTDYSDEDRKERVNLQIPTRKVSMIDDKPELVQTDRRTIKLRQKYQNVLKMNYEKGQIKYSQSKHEQFDTDWYNNITRRSIESKQQ